MKGFDSRWKNFPDYIMGITKQIWEERDIASLRHYYSDDVIVRSPEAIVAGNGNVINETRATLAEFPDRALYGEDVIWHGTSASGMLSSHRIISRATHLGDGAYGKASGKKLCYRTIAECHAINNQINDEWLVRDQGAIIRQLGWTPQAYCQRMIECTKPSMPFTPATDITGSYTGTGNNNEWGEKYASILTRIMSADMKVIPQEYDRACQLAYPGGTIGLSHADADSFWMQLRSAFPSATFTIEHAIGMDADSLPARAALRWSLNGKHQGWGAFGRPGGSNVYIMGMAQAEFGPWGLRREYVLYDEIAIWKQILLQQT